MKEVLIKQGGLEEPRMEYMDREKWRLFCLGHPLEGHFQMERGIRNYI